jgi:hypothetical protein
MLCYVALIDRPAIADFAFNGQRRIPEAALAIFPFPNQHRDHNHRKRDDHPVLERHAEKRESFYQPLLPHPRIPQCY